MLIALLTYIHSETAEMSDNYPPGAKNDPNAPWNKEEPEMIPCPDCGGSGSHGASADKFGIYEEECITCEGTGEIPRESYEPNPDSMKGGPDYE